MRRIPAERFWLDHALATASGVMAVYAVGRSIGVTSLPNVLAMVVLLAGLAGYGIALIVEDTKVQKADGWLFAAGAIFGILQTRTVNGMLPEEGFPFAIIAATMMFILLTVGGLFSWSDATLLFTSLPALVLFGLVGTIDSWRPGLFLFCGMILCIALLYARVHQRTMIKWAEEGGADKRYLRRDVWKWVAGPEYAFAAAGTIILLSFIGAPVVQTSLSGVSDAVRVNVRNQFRAQLPNNRPRRTQADAPIGTGPVNLSDRLMAEVEIPRPIYLRRNVYDTYSRRGWMMSVASGSAAYGFSEPGETLKYRRTNTANLDSANQTEEIPFKFSAKGWANETFPTPGPVVEIDNLTGDPIESTAKSMFFRSEKPPTDIDTRVLVPKEEQIDTKAQFPNTPIDSPAIRSYYSFPNSVGWANNPVIARVDMPDYERLMALRNAIAANSKYNTQTPPVPNDRDPVSYFLNESKMGYCDLFASAFVLEARRMGYPARYVTGFLMDSTQLQPDGTYHILEKHSHSWAEVYFEDYGWIAFDATAGAEDVTPKAGENESTTLIGRIREWAQNNIAIIGAVLGLAFVSLIVWLSRAKGVEVTGSQADRPIRIAATRFQMSLERVVGTPKRFSQTYREFAELHKPELMPLWNEIEAILPVLERVMFGATALPGDEVESMAKSVTALEKASKQLQKERKRAQRGRRKPA